MDSTSHLYESTGSFSGRDKAQILPFCLLIARPCGALPSVALVCGLLLRKVTTKGVKYIARGCPNMAVLNLYQCGKVQVCAWSFGIGTYFIRKPASNVRFVYSKRSSFGKMSRRQPVNYPLPPPDPFIPSSAPPQNGALIGLSKYCPRLSSLNVAQVGRITDGGVCALSRGCRHLQALNIAGAKEASGLLRRVNWSACFGLYTIFRVQ